MVGVGMTYPATGIYSDSGVMTERVLSLSSAVAADEDVEVDFSVMMEKLRTPLIPKEALDSFIEAIHAYPADECLLVAESWRFVELAQCGSTRKVQLGLGYCRVAQALQAVDVIEEIGSLGYFPRARSRPHVRYALGQIRQAFDVLGWSLYHSLNRIDTAD